MTALPDCFLRLPIAHRALHDASLGRPENSIAAIRAAVDAGYAIEIDIQMSSDGQAMVFHDYDLGRLTPETGAVRQHSAAELEEIPLKNGNETIPTFAKVLAAVAGRVPLLVEIKDQDGAMGPDTGELEKAIAHDLRGYEGDIAVMSFNPHSVYWMKELMPETPRGLVTGAFLVDGWGILPANVREHLRGIPDIERVEASFISHRADDLERDRVVEIRSAGMPLLCWTIKDEKAENLARKYADNITFEGYMAKHLPA